MQGSDSERAIPKKEKSVLDVNASKCSVGNAIANILNQLKQQGATLNDKLLFNGENDVLSLQLDRECLSEETLLIIPLTCMPLLADYKLRLKSSFELDVKKSNRVLNPSAEKVMSLMVELYNKTDKLKVWNDCFPFITLKKQNQILKTLISFRLQGEKLSSYWRMLESREYDKLLVESFLGSREFTYKKDALASAGIHTANDSEKGLLAIIDFLNHKMGDSTYQINRDTGCMEIHASNVDESGEVFVQYGFMDALQTYLTYGFVDVSAPILFSGKIQFRLKSGLNFVILGMAGGLQRTVPLPSEQQHLNQYLPPGIKRQDEHIVVNELVIPSGEQLSYLSESLSIIIKQCDVDNIYKDESILESEIQHIEQQVLTLNIQFWQQFAGLVERAIKSDSQFNNTTAQDLQTLIDTSITHCKSYAAHKGYKI